MNRAFRLVRNDVLGIWDPVAEIARGRGKRSGRSGAVLAAVMAALGMGAGAYAQAAEPVGVAPLPTELPAGGHVVAGAATISSPDAAKLNIDQATRRAIIDWNTFNVGSAAEVNFHQPDAGSATLNRVLDSNPSLIFGKIHATGQVFLTNPNGIYFGKSASVDVGGLVASTNQISDADFMSGNVTLRRDGSTGSVVNEGELHANLGGYIALLAPEVRNSGVVVARMGTVAMASGESITLNFDGEHLAGITVEPSAIKALVQNKGAVLAPGGLIVLSAKALGGLQNGVVNNSGVIEATGLSMKNGRIVLEASDAIQNSGTVSANAGADGSPAGSVELAAPTIENSGTITAAAPSDAAQSALAAAATASGGSISLAADTISQTASGTLDVSGVTGGSITLDAAADITAAGKLAAVGDSDAAAPAAAEPPSAGQGGKITLTAKHDVTLQDAVLDASGSVRGGEVAVRGGAPRPSGAPGDR
jgi:filamentous hemagglutinin family protein